MLMVPPYPESRPRWKSGSGVKRPLPKGHRHDPIVDGAVDGPACNSVWSSIVTDDSLEALLSEHARRTGVPGAAVAVLHRGATTAAYTGVADVTTGDPITPHTRFAIGSITKPMVATAIARLAAGGSLGLDDPLAAHVPELTDTPWAHRSTIRDLLANRGRVPLTVAWEFDLDLDGGDVLARYASLVSRADPAAPVWSYTNTGWCLLGRVVETATGEPWEQAMRRIVLDPSGMDATVASLSPPAEPRATGHQVTADGAVPAPDWNPAAYAASGSSLLSTVTDVLGFAATHLHDPDLEALRETHATTAIPSWLDAWCLGWARFDWDGATVWGWDGLAGGQRAALRIIPDRDAAVALTTNGSTGRALYRGLFADLLADGFGITMTPLRLEASPETVPDLDRYGGTYTWPDRRYHVTPAGDHLLLADDSGVTAAHPVDDRVFVVDAANPDRPAVAFDGFDDEGRPGILYRMMWALPRVDGD
jgi:CubicO group peptidase (beta-lactamase class C family)